MLNVYSKFTFYEIQVRSTTVQLQEGFVQSNGTHIRITVFQNT